jgi:hypothetical protein
MLLKLIIVAALVWWFFLRGKAQASTGVIQGAGPDFDPVTAGQVAASARGSVSVGDEWSATFLAGDGNWADAYRSHATADADAMNTGFIY